MENNTEVPIIQLSRSVKKRFETEFVVNRRSWSRI